MVKADLYRNLSAEEQTQQEYQTRLATVAQLHSMGLTAEQIASALDLPLDVVNSQL